MGRTGDFYTSVSVGPLFGQLLAYQFARWETESRTERAASPDNPFHLVEAGAHDGRLAVDLLAWMENHQPALFERLTYFVVEPSPTRAGWQRRALDKFAGRVVWVSRLAELPAAGVQGVIFSNELLDAFPIHRLGWDARARRWFEWGVVWTEDRFAWTRLAPADWDASLLSAGLEIPAGLGAVLPDGYTLELSPKAGAWWQEAAKKLRRGRLVTMDYGLSAMQMLVPERTQGTLRAYRHHAVAADPLADPGEQDLTAHVNFTQLQRAGESAGLMTEACLSQSSFLTRVARQTWQEEERFGAWTQVETRQFQTLTHPGHLGEAFRVLIQARRFRA